MMCTAVRMIGRADLNDGEPATYGESVPTGRNEGT